MHTFNDTVRVGGNDYAIELSIDDSGVIVCACCPTLDRLRKDNLPDLLRELKKIENNSKRGFKNPTAFMRSSGFGGADKVVEVEVTSIRDERTVWVKYKSKEKFRKDRGTEALSRLYTSRAMVEQAMAFEQRMNGEIRKTWELVANWTPEFKEEKKA